MAKAGVDDHSILVVDHDRESRELVAELLGSHGYAVRTADNGAHALRLLMADWRPRLIVLDLRMPIMDGPELADHLAEDPRWREIPLVIVSAHLDTPRARAMKTIGALGKPVDPAQLLALMRTVVPVRRSRPRSASCRREPVAATN